jgi:peptide/nickel transport system permease protein
VSLRYVLGKVAGALGTLAFVLAFNFFLFRVVDDNPVDNLFRGRNLSDSQMASLEERFGVGDPLWLQFVKYVRQTLHGDPASRSRAPARSAR